MATGDTDGPEVSVELIIALGTGVGAGEASFGPPQRFATQHTVGLTALHASQDTTYIATWASDEICLASVTRRSLALSLKWLECVPVGTLWDAARMDADADGSDELLVMRAGGPFESFRLDPGSPSGLSMPASVSNPTAWDRTGGLTTGDLDLVPGDEAVATGIEGDPLTGASVSTVVVHGGQSLSATVVADEFGAPHIAELTGDDQPDLLVGNTIYRGTGGVEFVEWQLTLADATDHVTLDIQGDGIADVARVVGQGLDCDDPGLLEVRVGPFVGSAPMAEALDGSHIDPWSALLVGDLDHDGIDELVSVGVDATVCPGGGRWTITSAAIGTSAPVDLCDAACSVVADSLPEWGHHYPIAAELIDVDGDGNLDLAALVEVG